MATQQKRSEPRHAVTYPCWIVIGDEPPIQARMLDASKSGVRIVTKDELTLPDRFTLALTADRKVLRHCRVAWIDGNQVGLSFIKSQDAAKAPKVYF